MTWLVLGLSCLGAPLGGRWVAAMVGTRVGAAMAAGAEALRPPETVPRGADWGPLRSPGEASMLASVPTEPSATSAPRTRRGGRAAPAQFATARGLLVRAATVLRIANGGLRPSGVPVSAQGARPAGILLQKVAALGLGLRDGDVLVSVAGTPATDVGTVIERIIAARAAGAKVIVGEIWRDGSTFPIAVEQPYLARRVSSASAEQGRPSQISTLPDAPDGGQPAK